MKQINDKRGAKYICTCGKKYKTALWQYDIQHTFWTVFIYPIHYGISNYHVFGNW